MSIETGKMVDITYLAKIHQALWELDSQLLLAELDRIAAMDLDPAVREALQQALGEVLLKKDPQLALETFIRTDGASEWGVGLGKAFSDWMRKEPAAALAWFDHHLEAGDFTSKSLDGENPHRAQFEAVAISSLLQSDPAAAAARLAKMTPAEQEALFKNPQFFKLTPESEADFAELVRSALPPDRQAKVLIRQAMPLLHEGGYERISSYLQSIGANAEEIRGIAEQAASQTLHTPAGEEPDRAELDRLRDWLRKESPEQVDAITGSALGRMWGVDLESRIAILQDLKAEGAGDEMVISFFERGDAMREPEAVRELAEGLQDAAKRQELLENIDRAIQSRTNAE